MDFRKIYRVLTIGKRNALHVDSAQDIFDPWALLKGTTRPVSPVIFKYMKGASGSTAYDFISTSYASLMLISRRVVSVLDPYTGWTTYPVEVYGKNGELIPGYHGLVVTGRCGPIDDNRSVPRIVQPTVSHGKPTKWWYGLYFDPKTWDGSDVFCPSRGGGSLFVTHAVKTALEQAKITNIEFTPLTEAVNMSSALMFSDQG